MQPLTVDTLRAYLMVASFAAMGAEVAMLLAMLVLPDSQQAFSSTPFRVLALAVIVTGVIVLRRLAHAAFELAIECHQVMPSLSPSRPVSVTRNCPRRWLVILHLRFTGRPFVLSEH